MHRYRPSNRFRIAKVEKKKDARIVGDLKVYITGKVKQEGNWIPTKAEPVSGGWVKGDAGAAARARRVRAHRDAEPERDEPLCLGFRRRPAGARQPDRVDSPQPKPLPTGTDETPVLIKPKK
jgi:hypothetical protein